MYIFPFYLYKIVPNCFPRLLRCCSVTKSSLFLTLCTTACQDSVLHYFPKLAQTSFVESVMPSNHLILHQPLLPLPSIFPSIRVPPSPIVDESLLSHILLDIIRFFFQKKSKIPYICVSTLYWCFSFWLTSFCIIGSSFIHLIRTDSNVFFLMAE